MARAILNREVVAQSDIFEVVEGNVYFPAEAVRPEFLGRSEAQSRCPWKGIASYYDLAVGGETFSDAAWYYAEPLAAAANIRGHVAFYAPPVVVER